MKIISKFHDYYDGAARMVMDDMPYIRKSDVHKTRISNKMTRFSGGGLSGTRRSGVIGFCGEIYPFMEITPYDKDDLMSDKRVVMYDLDAIIKEFKIVEESERYYHLFNRNRLTNDFNDRKNSAIYRTYFELYGTPVFAVVEGCGYPYHSSVIVTNPTLGGVIDLQGGEGPRDRSLNYFQFEKMVDPYTAAQQIDMYLSNNLASDSNPPIEISDKDKAIKHGHDGKYSFKQPPKKKRK